MNLFFLAKKGLIDIFYDILFYHSEDITIDTLVRWTFVRRDVSLAQ